MMDTSLSGLRVLLVEDEPLLAWELELAFSAAGAIVIGPASTLRMGCTLARENGLAAAVLDYRLGHEEVGPLAVFLYERGIPFILHTGHGAPSDAAWAAAVPIVRKPASPETIVQLVATLVDRNAAECSSFVTSGRHG